MIQFQYPELSLLAVPLWLAYRRWGRARGMTGGLRLVLLAVLLLALTGPQLNIGGEGVDVLVVADRSRSMPAEAFARIPELIRNLERNRGPGDRVGVITFGSRSEVEHVLSSETVFNDYTKKIRPDGSDLNAAIGAALNLVDANRPARILALTDGEANGPSPASAARRAREAGVPVDFRLFERLRIGDAAIESIRLPESVTPRQPFQFSVRVFADRDVQGTVRVRRGERLIAEADRDLTAGINRLTFRDVLQAGGLYRYTVELEVPGDPLSKNNRGRGVVRVEAAPRLLVLTADGREGNLVQALQAGRIAVDTAAAKQHSLTQDSLDPYRAVIIENVPAEHLGRLKMDRLAQFVEDLGGGLMLTGGERSFGTGGYFKSPLDQVLPVSMELRDEHRKSRVAITIALDRSGSMTAPVKGGQTKMDLANLGTAECVRLLSQEDMVAVVAVDSSPHVIQSLTPVNDPERIARRVLGIRSEGGGIFVYEALVAASNELMQAEGYNTRHIILFSDAADTEEPGDFKALLQKLKRLGITVSVIGLGTKSDVDAGLLQDIAKRGGGNIMFTADAQELPRLFTQDTMSVARNTFIKAGKNHPNGIPGALLPGARLLGELDGERFPDVGGYNLCYLKPDATAAVISQDDYTAPYSAFWYRGLGRAAALTVEVDGTYSGEFAEWADYEDFLITHARWLMGGEEPGGVFVDVQRDGQDALVTVELDPDQPGGGRSEAPELLVVPPGVEREGPLRPEFVWTGANTLQARVRMERTGTYRTLIKTGPRELTRGPAVTLPYSPEYVPRVGLPSGREILREMAELSGGTARTDVLEVFDDPPRSARMVPLLPALMVLGICLLLAEIAGRRLSLWQQVSEAFIPKESSAAGQFRHRIGWLPRWRMTFAKRKSADTTAVERRRSVEQTPGRRGAERDVLPPDHSMRDVLQQAKQRARRRLK